MPLDIGHVLDGKYTITGVIGRGGMGAVYLAENTRVHRQVAIKILLNKDAGAGDAMIRFEREAQAAGRIGSEHIVEVLDLGTTADGDRFMVMEYLEGETLKGRLRRGRLLPEKVVSVFAQLLEGLEAAHVANIVHRDLKPDNVFLQKERAGQRDWIKILDFGISKFNELSHEDGQVTQAGTVMGTPFYMSPEQARAASEVDTRSDLYSVAVMLFEALTGQVPFRGTTFAELLFKIVVEPQPHPKTIAPNLDDGLCAIIVKGIDRNPALRFQTAAEFRRALLDWDAAHAARPNRPAPASTAAPLPLPPPSHPDLVPEAPTLLWQGAAAAAATAVLPPALGDSRSGSGPTSETQKTWDDGAATPRKRGPGVVIAAVAATLLGGGAAAVLAFSGHGAASKASPAASVTASAVAVTATPSAEAVPVPSVSASALPTASASVKAPAPSATHAAEAPAHAMTAPPSAPTSAASAKAHAPPKPGKVVTDYGY